MTDIKEETKTPKVEFHFFWGGPFSNWYLSPLTLPHPVTKKPQKYTCVEQRLMHYKALLMNDFETAEKILACHSPMSQKALGRKVTNYDDALWSAKRFDIAIEALIAKFSQNKDLLKLLAPTGSYVEASPKDKIWGIGMGVSNPKCQNPSQWKGLNLLGKAIDKARDALLKS